jgi:hypothetical protein
MKNIAIIPLFFFATACAQHFDSPTQVTDNVIAGYKAGMTAGCMKTSMVKMGDSPSKANAYCGCMMKRLNERLTHSEWQNAFYYGDSNRHPEEIKLLLSHLQDLPTCRDGL